MPLQKTSKDFFYKYIKIFKNILKSTFFYCRAPFLLKCERLHSIMNMAIKGQCNLPSIAKRSIMQTVTKITFVIFEDIEIEQYWTQTLQPVRNRFMELVNNDNFPKAYHQEEVRLAVIDVLECLIGIVQLLFFFYCCLCEKKQYRTECLNPFVSLSGAVSGCRNKKYFRSEIPRSMFNQVFPVLNELPKLLSMYHNYQQIVQLILEMFWTCSQKIVYLLKKASSSNSDKFYNVCNKYYN